ncbi:hypothetical protein Pint_34335 [Pistacia integerrima]|uniref:Uncharacterized protein n=1 Tax=Pistacia integerrima TaxID=434235 RepID=A0ACC0X5P3_9ROSI|nr:hypothetical protein Pint_34335 [Pistacia integerrima]
MTEMVEDIVIVGAGIAGLTTSLGLHGKYRYKCACLYRSSMRDSDCLYNTGEAPSEKSLKTKGKHGDHEVRCVKRKLLLEALETELPSGTISELRWWRNGLASRSVLRRSHEMCLITRGRVMALRPQILAFFGKGIRCDGELEDNPAKMKQFVLSNVHVPDQLKQRWCLCSGDALHPMTPTLVKTKERTGEDEEKFKKIEMGLKRYAKERRWRSFELISTAYVAGLLKKRADFNCGKLRHFLNATTSNHASIQGGFAHGGVSSGWRDWRVIVDRRIKMQDRSFRRGMVTAEEQLRQKSWRKEDLKANVRVVEIFATHRNTWQAEERRLLHADDAANEEMPNLRSKIEEMEREKVESKRRVEELEEMIGFMSRRGGCEFEEEEDQFGGCGLWKFGSLKKSRYPLENGDFSL